MAETTEVDLTTFGTRIRSARTWRGLTLDQAARQIGISPDILLNAEHGGQPRRVNRDRIVAWLEDAERGRPRVRQPITSVGLLLHAVLAAQGLTQVQVADELGVSVKHLSQVATGKVGLNHELAVRLETVTGVPAMVWSVAEAAYRDARIRAREACNA